MLKTCNKRKPRKFCSLQFFPFKLKCSLFGALKCMHKQYRPSWSLIDFLFSFALTAFMKTWNNALEIWRATEMIDSWLLFRHSELTFLRAEGYFWCHHPVFTEESTAVSGILSQAWSLAIFLCAGLGVLIPNTSSVSPELTVERCCCAGFSNSSCHLLGEMFLPSQYPPILIF